MRYYLILLITMVLFSSCSTLPIERKVEQAGGDNILKITGISNGVEKVFGSAFLFHLNNKDYIITAAHVVNSIEFNRKSPISEHLQIKIANNRQLSFALNDYIIPVSGVDVAIITSKGLEEYLKSNPRSSPVIQGYCEDIKPDDKIIAYYHMDDERFPGLIKSDFLVQEINNKLEYNYLSDRLVSFGASGGAVLRKDEENYCLVGAINSIFKSKTNPNSYINGGALIKGSVIYGGLQDYIIKKIP